MNITILIGHLVKERHKLLYDFCLFLSENGFTISVVTGFPSRRISEQLIEYYKNLSLQKINDNFLIYRVGSKKGEGKSLIIRFIKYLFLSIEIIKKAKEINNSKIIVFSTPPLLSLFALNLKNKSNKLYLYLQDIFPDSLFNLFPIFKFSPFYILRLIEKYTYNRFDKIIVISENIRTTILKRTNREVLTIYNWFDASLKYISHRDNFLYNKFNIDKSNFNIVYGGDIGNFQNIKLILHSAKYLKSYPINFIFIGNGSYLDKAIKYKKSESLDNVIFIPFQNKDFISSVYSLGDLQLLPLKKEMYRFALPSKFLNILACNSKILAIIEAESEVSSFINKFDLGFVFSEENPSLLSRFILSIYHDYFLPSKTSHQSSYSFKKNHYEFLSNFTITYQVKKLIDII